MIEGRLERQIAFILEVDKLKTVLRRSYVLHDPRRENSAEHSWHVGLMAMVLAEHASEPVDVARVVKMLLIHDVVELDVGDVLVYDEAARAAKAEQERVAAARIFGLLPDDLAAELHELWVEYEDQSTPEARFARVLDRLMPFLHNYHGGGRTWREHDIKKDQVLRVNSVMSAGSEALWEYTRAHIERAAEQGLLRD